MELDVSKPVINEEEHNLPIPYEINTKSEEIIVIKSQRARKRRHSKKHQLGQLTPNKRRRSSILSKPPFENLDLTGFKHLPNIGPNSLTVLLGEALIQYFQEHEEPMTDTEEPNHNEHQQNIDRNSSPLEPQVIHEESTQVIDEEMNQEASQVPIESKNNNQFTNYLSPVPSARPLEKSNPSISVPEKVEHDGLPSKIPKKKKKKRRSSDSSDTSKPKPIKFENPPENELNDEWLHFTESELSLAETHLEDQLYEENSKYEEGESKSDVMMKEMSLYYKILRWTGRMPLEMRRYLDFTFFTENRRGWNYRLYCSTSIIMTLLLSVMLANFIAILSQKRVTSYEEIEVLEFDKYWSFALFTLFNLWYVVITSLFTIFQGSFHLRQYLTRWNVCCNLMGFDTSYQLRSITKRELYLLIVYSLLLITGMIADTLFSDWNGCFGFLSLLLLRKWIRRFRVSNHYGWLRWVGVLIHLYSLFTSRLMSATVILYCRAVENAARRFNFRLVCMLGNVGQVRDDGKVIILRRMIPYKVLLAEHLAITTFSRNIGFVFSVCLTTFIITKAFSIIISAYTLLLIINGGYTTDAGHDNYNHSSIATFEERKLSAPIKYYSSLGTATLILGVITFFSWGTFWYTTECIRDVGSAIMQGIGYVHRHGLMLCKSSKERRFVLTMQSSFNPKNDYFINGINRHYIFGFAALLFSYSVTLLGFSIQRMSNKEIFICGESGQCIGAKYNPRIPGLDLSGKVSSKHGGRESVDLLESAIRKAITKGRTYAYKAAPTAAATKRAPTIAATKRAPTAVATKRAPTAAATKQAPTTAPEPMKPPDAVVSTAPPEPPPPELPFEWDKFIKDYFYQCDTYPKKGKFLRLRMYFQTDPKDGQNKAVYDSKVSHNSALNKEWCEQINTPWKIKTTKVLSDADFKEIKAENNSNWKKLCYGSYDVDDCGNIGISLPDKEGNLKQPKLELVKIKLISKNPKIKQATDMLKDNMYTYWHCCYQWEGYENQNCGLSNEAFVKKVKGKTLEEIDFTDLLSQQSFVSDVCGPSKFKDNKCGKPTVKNPSSYHCKGFNSV